MKIFNTGSDDFETASTEILEGLQQQRSELLGTTIDIHVGIGLLAGIEAGRLAQKYGDDDARVQLLRDRGEVAAARVNALSVEHEIAAVRTPPPPDTGAVIHGRITDVTQRAAGTVSVLLIGDKDQPVAGVDPVETDDTGYFAFELKPETVKAISGKKLSVQLRVADVQLAPAAAETVTIAPGATLVMEVPLSSTELERLRLRIPVAGEMVKAAADDDKAAADKAAADKSAADKAADRAAAAQAAADKSTADKAADKVAAAPAAADKSTADKAADKVAAAPAATDKSTADKAADKVAAAPAAADKSTADKAADKAAAAPAAADKSTADKAADKVAAAPAAADKSTADKAADKRAANKAAVEEAAAAETPAADKTAADKEAASKTATKPPAQDGSTGKKR